MAPGKQNTGTPIKCDCGKLVAVERGGRVYVLCRHCKREIEVLREPGGHEPGGH